MSSNPLRYFIGLFLVCLFVKTNGQNENSKWYFGTQAGLDFMTNPPTILTNGLINTNEGCAAIASPAGSLVMYTDGITIWDKTHAVMANGSGLTGNSSTTQSGVIVKQPGNSNIYFVFTLGVGPGALSYSTVDMNLAAGNGSVITKNVLLTTGNTEKLTSVKHCNGIDIWVISHQNGSSNYNCFLVSSAGVNTTAVVSAVGTSHASFIGNMKVSPNGKKIAVGIYGSNVFELCDFDNSTGIVSNPIVLMSNVSSPYGVEFSPDGTKLYGDRESGFNGIYQWDLCAGSPTAIINSLYTMTTTSQCMGMQLAIDGKIYVSRSSQTVLGVINNPNAVGAACNYSHTGQSIAPKQCRLNLPNFITSGFKPPPPPFTFTMNTALGCQTASFTAPAVINNFSMIACAATGYSLNGLMWNFGNPASGPANTSTLMNPSHAFTTLGTYTVSLILYYTCGGGTDTIKGVVNVNQPCISVTSQSITCANLGSATVTATGGAGPYSYTWSPTNQTTAIASGLSPGTYTITVFDFGNNFTYTALTQFTSLVPLTGSISTSPSVSCYGANTGTGQVSNLAGGSGTQTITWTNGTTTYTSASTNSLTSGVWSVNVTDALTGCQLKQTFFISQTTPLNPQVSSSSPSACAGNSVVLTGTNSGGAGPYTYSWNPGPASPTAVVNEPLAGNHVYTLISLDDNGCLSTATIAVNFVSSPTITVGNASVCPLKSGTLTANGATSYTWFTGGGGTSNGQSFSAGPAVNTQYTVVGSASGCTSSATASIVLLSTPVPTFTTNSPVCNGQNLQLSAGGGVSYLWTGPQNFGSVSQNPVLNGASPNQSGTYNFTVTGLNSCTASSSGTALVNPTPTVTAGGSTVCNTGTMSLFANSVAGAGYSWSGPLGFLSSTVGSEAWNSRDLKSRPH